MNLLACEFCFLYDFKHHEEAEAIVMVFLRKLII